MFKKLLILCCVVLPFYSVAQCTFTNPIKTSAADPQITYIDGYYYYLYTTGSGVELRRHQNMHEVGNESVNSHKKVWSWNSEIIGHVWAPEIHKINGKFYIYASGSVTGDSNPESMRMFVLEANTSDPFGTYTYKGLLSNNYAIDQSVWQDPTDGSLYMSYSQWDNNIPGANPASLIQCTYICKMISPTQMGAGVRLSYPATSWEKHKWWVNEGQYFLKKGNKLHIVFSVSGCAAAEYSLAMLTCSNGDYLNPAAWTKSTAPVFTQDPTKSVYGTGHHSTVQTPNGEWWLVYHAVSDPAGSCGGIRSTRMQPFTFDANDNPVFGTPVATGVALTCPGSMNPPNYWNFTSTLEGWNTPMNLTATASAGFANLTITNADPYIHSPNNLNVSASDYKYVIVSMQNQTSSNTAELFWSTTASPNFDGAKRVSFAITPNDTKQRTYIIDLSANANWNGTIKQLRIDPTLASSGTVKIDYVKFAGAYPSTISTVAGTVEIENFNKGGNNNAYYDKDIANLGGQYRTAEQVDIETCAKGGYNVGWLETGEWMEYLVKVSNSGNYSLSLDVASVTNSNTIQFYCDGELLGFAFTVNNTGGLQTYTQLSQNITLTGGVHLIKILAQQSNGGLNINAFTLTELPNVLNSPSSPITNADLVATDALGRTIPDYASTGASRANKYVGMFYYIWLGTHGNKVYDITKILKQYPADPLSANNPGWGGSGAFHFWGEPEMGYYRSDDPWVIRRNMTMLANAGVDFIFFDVTNAVTYLNVVDTVCRIITELRAEGIAAPYISFTTNSSSGQTMNNLYDKFYSLNKYKDTWFIWQGKPLMMGDPNDVALRDDVKNFFTLKRSWVGSAHSIAEENFWPWLAWYPQGWGWSGSTSNREQVSVSVAFHPQNPQGKSYSFISGAQPAVDSEYKTTTTGQGKHFEEQWSRAHEVDPQIVMVTQWNEWIAQRFLWDVTKNTQTQYAGRPVKQGDSYFVDVFSQEFNRDIEPMKGGYTDNFYYQLVSNTRKYKGLNAPQVASAPKTISIDGTFTEWTTVTPVLKDPQGDTKHRNYPSYDPTKQLVNTTGRNDIIESRTTIDGSYVYFYIKTAANITPYTNPNWMMVYLNTDKNKTTGWEGFDYVINMGVTSATETTIQKRIGTSWTTVGSATYRVVGNQMEIAVPRSALGYTATNVAYYYQIFDNPQVLDNIEDNFINGESAPDRRFNYSYANTQAYVQNTPTAIWNFTSDLEGWTLANNVSGQVNTGIFTVNVNGGDPYIVSANNVNFDAATHNKLKLVLQNKSTATSFQLFYRTSENPNTWESTHITVKPNDTQQRDYFADLSSIANWKGTIVQLRLDFGDTPGQQVLIDQIAFMQQKTEFHFIASNEGWLPANSITGSVNNSIYTLNITGADPQILSPADLNLDAGNFNQINLVMQNKTVDTDYQIFFITSDDSNWNEAKSIHCNVPANQTAYTTVSVGMVKNPAWKGNIKQIRIDPGNGTGLGQVLIDKISFSLMDFGIDNGVIHLKQDLTRGGAISYISKSGTTRSLVNIADEGRYIQQSYYAGNSINRIADGQSPDWSPWSWNPIQVGDYGRNRAQILEYQQGADNLYVKCTPMLWDMNGMNAEAEMEQWSTLIGNRIHVKCRLTCHRTDNLYGENVVNGQEYPAVYPISALHKLYTYTGNSPFTNAAVENPAVVNLSSGFWGVYPKVSEHWMAFVDNNNWGMGIYNAKCDEWLAGMAGNPGDEALGGSTSYIAPSGTAIINKNTILEYEYDIIIGSLDEIRTAAYTLHNATTVTLTPYTQINGGAWTQTATATLCAGGSVSFGPHPNIETGWTWTGPNGFTATTRAISFTNIASNKAGNYIATYTDASGNKGTQTFTINVNALPTATISNTTPTTFCQGGSVVLTASAGTSYKWFNGATVLATTTASYTANATGSYTVEITNANNCKATSAATVVTVNALPTVTIQSNTPCVGDDLQLQASGGVSYAWNKATVWTSTEQNPIRTNVHSGHAGTYRVVVTDANNCKNEKSIAVTVNDLPAATVSTTTASNGLANGTIKLTFTDNPARTNISFSIDNGATYTSVADNLGTYTFNAVTAGKYKVYTRWGNAECPVYLGEYTVPASLQITLAQGWNLISTNLHPADSTIENLFAGLDVAMVKDMNGFWKKGQIPAFNSLKTITAGNGCLVNMNTAGTLTISGTPMLFSNFQIGTSSNWYLIGYPGCTDAMHCVSTPISNYFNTTNCQTIKNFDGFWVPNGTTNSIQNFEVGKGYFLKK